MASQPEVQDNRDRHRDLLAEIELRGATAPLHEVQGAADALLLNAEEQRVYGDPEDAEFVRQFEEFKRQRDRAQ
jgi:hypothetical protein